MGMGGSGEPSGDAACAGGAAGWETWGQVREETSSGMCRLGHNVVVRSGVESG